MSIQIPCPQCGRELRLPDRSLLGRKGKCPKCGHTFILEEPSAVTLELVRPESTSAPSGIPDFRPASDFSAKTPSKTTGPSEQTHGTAAAFGTFDSVAPPKSAAARLKESQKKNARRRNVGIAIAALFLVAAGVVAKFAPRTPDKASGTQTPTEEVASNGDSSDDEVYADGFNPTLTQYAKLGSPTKGKPIELQFIPFGTQVVINIHPAELWKEMSLGEEIRYCMPPVAKLIESTLNDLFKTKPEQVEELLICLIPGTRGTLPDIAAVAHMIDEQKRSQLIEQFGKRVDTYGEPVYLSGERAYMIADLKTLVVCPKSQAEEMVKAMQVRHPIEQIDPLLPTTDRSRHLTLIFTPLTLSLQETWFPENFRPFIKSVVDWLGEDTEAVACSFHLTDDLFYSDVQLRNKGPALKKYEQRIRNQLKDLAGDMVSLIGQMNPKEQGKRMVIGRLPAMIEVFSMATIVSHESHHLQLVTPLPDRAAANMVLGTLLAWDESTRTEFSKAKPVPTESSNVPAMVADRLKMKIDVDFRAMPLNEAFAFVGGEIKTPIQIDGDGGLKMGGFTKNIKQTFAMDAARAQDVILKIFEESKGIQADPAKNLVLIVDESKKSIFITTSAVATSKKLTPYVFAK